MHRRIQRIILDRFHIAYTRRIITAVIEIMVQGDGSGGKVVTHTRQHYEIFQTPSPSLDIIRYLWNIHDVTDSVNSTKSIHLHLWNRYQNSFCLEFGCMRLPEEDC